ncbi:MAG: PAS domain S-box protein [Nitrospirae bacterium]|nr:PAS domain S-box protein [Nitrospirota bacterium]
MGESINFIIVLLFVAVLLKIAAIYVAVRLFFLTRSIAVLAVVILTTTLMIVRNIIRISYFVSGGRQDSIDINETYLSVLVSFFLFITIVYIYKLFKHIKHQGIELEQSKYYYKNMIDVSPAGIFKIDTEGRCMFVNEQWCEMVSLACDKAVGFEWTQIIHDDDKSRIMAEIGQCSAKDMSFRDEFRLNTPDFSKKWVLLHMIKEISFSGKTEGYLGTIIDVTKEILFKKKIEEDLKEKTLLIREVHHRTKNNLALISSIIRIQSVNADSQSYKDLLKELNNRIKTMAYIHDTLYKSDSLTVIAFDKYVRDIVLSLLKSYSSSARRITSNFEMDEVTLTVKKAVPLGMAINEMVTNSLKYAFVDKSDGVISFKMKRQDGEILITFSDNGVGFDNTIDLTNLQSLGVPLIMNIVKNQIGGTVELLMDNGTEYRIMFKEDVGENASDEETL